MAIEPILGTDSGKVAFEKTGRNMASMDTQLQTLDTAVNNEFGTKSCYAKKEFARKAAPNMSDKTWKLRFVGGFAGKLIIRVYSEYSNNNSAGFIEKVFNLDSWFQNKSAYTNRDQSGNEFSIGEFLFNRDTKEWTCLIKSNNSISLNGIIVHAECNARQLSDKNSFNTIQLSDCYSDATVNKDTNRVVTITEKTDILFPYSSGFEKVYSTDASGVSKCNNFVTVNLNVIKSDNTEITSHDVIAVLPSGYRPPKAVFCTCFDGRYVKSVGVVVRDNGYVQTTSYVEGLKTLVGQISFYTE